MKNVIFILALFLTFNLLIAGVSAPPTDFKGNVTVDGNVTATGSVTGFLDPNNVLDAMPVGFSYLTTQVCWTGYTAVEDGFIQLGSSTDTAATGSNSRNLEHSHTANTIKIAGHNHGDPDMSITSSGTQSMPSTGHDHTLNDEGGAAIQQDTTGIRFRNVSVGAWTGNGSKMVFTSTTSSANFPYSNATALRGSTANDPDLTNYSHGWTHAISCSGNCIGKDGGSNGDADITATGNTGNTLNVSQDITPRHIVMRLCVRN